MATRSKVRIRDGIKSKLPHHLLPEFQEADTLGLGAESAWGPKQRQTMTCMSGPTAGKAELGK